MDARSYLTPPHSSFWRWDDNGKVVTWTDGAAIAFRLEVLAVCRRLAPQGLPPFGALVLLLAAMRSNWRESSAEPGILVGILNSEPNAEAVKEILGDVLGKLDKVNYLCAELDGAADVRLAIVETVFDRRRGRTSPEFAAEVVELLDDGLDDDIIRPTRLRRPRAYGPAQLLKELFFLQLGLRHVDAESIRLRCKTGLDEAPDEADVELPPALRVRALLNRLQADDEHHGLARLAQRMMAAVTLPRKMADWDDLPLGGVSDITNRGPLDRLLLSELAHDDLTLAVRIAVNEALYLRRESPPRNPPRHRHLLLETGLRSWGTPRVFAAAVALALAATAEATIDVSAFRADGFALQPIDLTTRGGLIAHLAALSAELHPGDALPALAQEMENCDNAAEPVLITTDDVLEDRDFRRALAERFSSPLLIASVNRDGGFRLLERTPQGEKLLRQAKLDLDDLFVRRETTGGELVDKSWARDLPAICSLTPFPLLLPHAVHPKKSVRIEERRVLALTNDRRLMLWTSPLRGAQQITPTAPLGDIHWCSPAEMGDTLRMVVGPQNPQRLRLLHVDLPRLRCAQMRLETGDESYRAVCVHNGALFLVGRGFVDVFDLSNGKLVQRLQLPNEVVWQRDRFFWGSFTATWFALSFDGRSACLEPVVREKKQQCPPLQSMFDRQGFEGPIGITKYGDFYYTATGITRRVPHGLAAQPVVAAIANDGGAVVLGTMDLSNSVLCRVDVDTLNLVRSAGDPLALVNRMHDVVRPVSLRHRFVSISVDQQDSLVLTTRKRERLRIVFHSHAQQIRLQPVADARPRRSGVHTFKPVPAPPGVGYRLSVATWYDGSQAFLDTRGLLHLRSADEAVCETTIVLCDGELSGWCADGRLWGAPFFIGDAPSAAKHHVYETAIQAFARRVV